jgi:hypothetical protein
MSRAEAIKQLGKEDDYINLKGFNTERDIAQDTYNTDYNALQNKFNELLATADRNKATAKTDFNSSRDVLNRNSYMNTRGKTGADLSSRGLSKGFGSGGKFVSNLQRNNASSTLANTYYDAMADIQRDIDKGTQDHSYNMEKLKLDLDRTIASINAREAEKRNAYRTAVAQLAEQIQARNEAKDFAQKQLDAAEKQYQLELNAELVKRYTPKDSTSSDQLIKMAQQIVKDGKVKSGDKPIDNVGDALAWLNNNGVYRLEDVKAADKARYASFDKKQQKKNTKISNPLLKSTNSTYYDDYILG